MKSFPGVFFYTSFLQGTAFAFFPCFQHYSFQIEASDPLGANFCAGCQTWGHAVDTQLLQHHLLKMLFSPVYVLCLFVKFQMDVNSCLAVLFHSTSAHFYFCPSAYCFQLYDNFIMYLEVWSGNRSSIVLPQDCFCSLGSFLVSSI